MSIAVQSKIEEDGDCDKQMKKGTEERKLVEIDGGGDEDFQISLPMELILEFLSRLPIKSLMRLSCTSKYLYNTVNQNPHFCRSHLINYSQKNPLLVLYVNCITTENPPKLYKNLFYSWDVDEYHNDNHDVDFRLTIPYSTKGNFWGYCNGLVCFGKKFSKTVFRIDVWNFTTKELLRIIPPVIDLSPNTLLSHGFGYDSINNEYKLVLTVFNLKTGCYQSLVYTFGTKSFWKQVNLQEQKVSSYSSTFAPYGGSTFTPCGGGGGGALFWRTMDPQVILQFDLHQDKFQYIQIPLESNEFPASNNHIRLFESKGFLGVAILIQSKSTSTTTSLEKVHLKIYRDNQVWVKETFDIAPYSLPFSANFRFTSFSDQVLMYWMDPNSFQFFNLHSKCLKVVRKLSSCKGLPQHARPDDYSLICEVQNICSLTNLLPERAKKSDEACFKTMMTKDINDMCLSQEPKTCRGFLMSLDPTKTTQHYYFFNDN